MNSTANLLEAVKTAFAGKYPHYPVTVCESADDRFVLCVRVFAVPADQVRAVKAVIQQIERDLVADGQYLLLPMVKNLDVTREHYPEYLPPEPAEASGLVRGAGMLNSLIQGQYEWMQVSLAGVAIADARLGRSACDLRGFQPNGTPVAVVEDELALAA